MGTDRADFVVVGAGIIGAAVAMTLQQRHEGADVVLLDKESGPARHQTSHNSGVIHAGVYYKPGSAKAKLCVSGAARMIEFCKEHAIPFSTSGKLIVAIDENELPALQELAQRAESNGVSGVRLLTPLEFREIEPNAGGLKALHVPGTAVTDFARVAQKMVDLVELTDDVRYNAEAVDVKDESDGATVSLISGDIVKATHAIVCAGLQSDRIARASTHVDDVRILPFRGSYYELTAQAADRVKSMIYPVPDPRFPFLGVHFTRHIDQTVSCGPNAVISLARESYRRYALRPRDLFDVVSFPGSWKLAAKYWQEEMREVVRDSSKRAFATAAAKYLPEITVDDFAEAHHGIRAQAVRRDGALVDDFSLVKTGNVLHVRNAPSPAATASLTLAEHIVDELDK